MRTAAVLALGLLLSAPGCGSNDAASTAQEGPRPGSLDALWKRPGEDVALVMGTSDYAPGPVGASFLVLTHRARPIERPTARVWLSRALDEAPFRTGTARLEDVGKGQRIYVVDLEIPGPGTYFLLAEPVGGTRIQGVGNVVVGDRAKSPAVGDRAFPSKTPTLADAPAAELTTSNPPDTELLRVSVADALARKERSSWFSRRRSSVRAGRAVPWSTSSTPCGGASPASNSSTSRSTRRTTCVRRRPGRPDRAKFEGAVSERELEAAVRRFLA